MEHHSHDGTGLADAGPAANRSQALAQGRDVLYLDLDERVLTLAASGPCSSRHTRLRG